MNDRVLKTIPPGTTLTVLARQGNWVKVRAPDGSVFWVSGSYVKTTRPAPSGTVVNGKLTGELNRPGFLGEE